MATGYGKQKTDIAHTDAHILWCCSSGVVSSAVSSVVSGVVSGVSLSCRLVSKQNGQKDRRRSQRVRISKFGENWGLKPKPKPKTEAEAQN